MRKQTKLVAVLSAAALLAIGASMTSFAAKGWVEENGSWYYDKTGEGDYASYEWEKSGNNWFWLGTDGAMVTNALVEDDGEYYYVNANGAMVTNVWVAVEPGDDAEDDAPEHYWYRFVANGKALRKTSDKIALKTVNGKKYAFDESGKMLYGYVDADGNRVDDSDDPFIAAEYYFGTPDDGAMHTGWAQYTDGSEATSAFITDGRTYADYEQMWLYFKPTTGKKAKMKDGSTSLKEETINGQKYAFDENGVMVYDWNNVASPNTTDATPNKYFSTAEDGHLRKNTWIWSVPAKDINEDDYNDDTYRWFHVNENGKTDTKKIKTINGKKYIFDESGIMKSGLVIAKDRTYQDKVDLDATDGATLRDTLKYHSADDDADATVNGDLYYFGDEETDGSMKTGKQISVELNGEVYTMAFDRTTGKAWTKIDNRRLYKNGFLLTASSDNGYEKVDFDGKAYVIGTTGTTVSKGSSVKDSEGDYYAVYKADKNGGVTGANVYMNVEDTAKWQKQTSDDKMTEGAIVKFSGDYAQQQASQFKQDGYVKGCVDTVNDK